MVTIKIQRRGDIIGAYLQTLGFGREKAAEVSDGLSGMIDGDLNNGDEIIAALDELLLLTARKIWPLSEYSSEQLTALFKLLYLNNDGADRWGVLVFSDKEIPEDMRRIMSEHNLQQAPDYAYAPMQAQKIEPAISKSWLHRLLHLTAKKAS